MCGIVGLFIARNYRFDTIDIGALNRGTMVLDLARVGLQLTRAPNEVYLNRAKVSRGSIEFEYILAMGTYDRRPVVARHKPKARR